MNPHKCPLCNGNGTIPNRYDSTSANEKQCHGCNGTGILWSEK